MLEEGHIPRPQELFNSVLSELSSEPNDEDRIEGVFAALGGLAHRAIYKESTEGSPADSDVYSMVSQLQDAIFDNEEDVAISSRLTGMLDLVASAARSLPPQLTDDEYAILRRIKEERDVPLDEVRNFVFPPLVDTDPWGNVEVTLRGQYALDVYLTHQFRQQSGQVSE